MLRAGVAVVLLAVGGWAAVTLAALERRTVVVDRIGDRLDRLHVTVTELGIAQAAYLVPGEEAARSLESIPRLLTETAAAIAEMGPLLRSPEATRALQAFADATSTLTQRDAQARDSLFVGDTLTTAQIVMGDAGAARATMQQALGTIRTAESAAGERARAEATAEARLVLGGVAGVWLVGLLALIPAWKRSSAVRADPPPPAASATTASAVNLEEVAALCMEIARVETSEGVDALLGRAARALDATRVVLWVAAGDELVPVIVHGGSADEDARPMPVRRDADRDVSRAWRRAEVQTVPSDAGSPAEILAPMIGAAGCSGVFAAQLRNLSETDSTIRTAVVLIAAQLSTVISGMPAQLRR